MIEIQTILPTKIKDNTCGIEDKLDWLIEQFRCKKNKILLTRCADLAIPSLSGRWQLGYLPIIKHNDLFSDNVYFPNLDKLNENTRAKHSIEVATCGVFLSKNWDIEEEDMLMIALSGLIHDFLHISFSHLGEEAFQKIVKYSKMNDPDFYDLLVKNGAHISHEESLQDLLSSPDSHPLSSCLYQGLNNSTQELKAVLSEEGTLGSILKLVDTCAYLNTDSIYCGLDAPYFEQKFVDILSPGRGILKIKDSLISRATCQEFLDYRMYMFCYQYCHPVAQVIEKMQTNLIYQYLKMAADEKTRSDRIIGLLIDNDLESLKKLRKFTLEEKDYNGLGFFILPEKTLFLSQDYTEEQHNIFMQDILVKINPPQKKFLSLETELGSKIRIDSSDMGSFRRTICTDNKYLGFKMGESFINGVDSYIQLIYRDKGLLSNGVTNSLLIESIPECTIDIQRLLV